MKKSIRKLMLNRDHLGKWDGGKLHLNSETIRSMSGVTLSDLARVVGGVGDGSPSKWQSCIVMDGRCVEYTVVYTQAQSNCNCGTSGPATVDCSLVTF